MAEYYLMSQLPSLDGIGENVPVPITEARFLELCGRFLSSKAKREVENITLIPSLTAEHSSSSLITAWNDGERTLRLALSKARAEKMAKQSDTDNVMFPVELVRTAVAAVEAESPLEAENFLFQYRLNFLESLRPTDIFSEEYVYYYALKLKLLLRARKFDTHLGETAYRNIYNSIMSGDKLEAI